MAALVNNAGHQGWPIQWIACKTHKENIRYKIYIYMHIYTHIHKYHTSISPWHHPYNSPGANLWHEIQKLPPPLLQELNNNTDILYNNRKMKSICITNHNRCGLIHKIVFLLYVGCS